jgi:hypothetical protein
VTNPHGVVTLTERNTTTMRRQMPLVYCIYILNNRYLSQRYRHRPH